MDEAEKTAREFLKTVDWSTIYVAESGMLGVSEEMAVTDIAQAIRQAEKRGRVEELRKAEDAIRHNDRPPFPHDESFLIGWGTAMHTVAKWCNDRATELEKGETE